MQNIKNREIDLLHYCLSVNSQHGCFRRNKRARHLHRLLNIISQVLAICGWWASSGMRHVFVFDLFWYYFPLWICQLTFWAHNNTCLSVLIFFFFYDDDSDYPGRSVPFSSDYKENTYTQVQLEWTLYRSRKKIRIRERYAFINARKY